MLRLGLIIAGVIFVADQIAKWLILGPGAFSPPGCLEAGINCRFIEISPIFDLQMVWNRGFSFGLGRAQDDLGRWALVAMQLGISGVFLWWLRTAVRKPTAIALGLVIGGALGNVIDRIRFGAVADFLDFSMNGNFFPWVFNVADAAITCGAILLAIDMVFFAETEPGKGTGWSQIKARFKRGNGGTGGSGG
ncbi:signal peptidase II [Candidatus Viadribacter manganicus]|uniref:signal peptidase II n=1 Tax=Candidatus Viadribacter manganicus TaxID=1759059 RepID=UPI00082D477B|nr:signal peptidase II [Candidatus Viadribacter manganicus]